MVGHSQCHGIVLAGDPAGQALAVRHQPGVGPRPAAGQAIQPALRQILEEEIELLDAVGDQDQAFFHRPLLQRQQAMDRFAVPGVATQPPDRLGGISNHTAGPHHTGRLLYAPIADHRDLC